MKKKRMNKRFVTLILAGVLWVSVPTYAKEITIPSKPDETVSAEPASTEEDGKVRSGWDAEKKHYYKDGTMVKGFNWVEDSLYYFDKKGKLYTKKGFQEINQETYYIQKDASVATGVLEIDEDAYYFDTETGIMAKKTGVVKLNGNYYNFDEDFTLQSGWYRNSKNKRYYFSKETYAALTGWNYVGKYKYCFKKNGQLIQDVRKKLTKKQKSSYTIRVNRKGSCVTVYAKDGKRGYTIPVVAFVCSAGNNTPLGTFTIKDKLRWHELDGPSWGQWCEHLTTNILFHSVYYDRERDNKSLNVKAYNKLGTVASHGCIRLRAGDAKWIYDNCKIGTKVTIYDNKKVPGPFDKPKAKKLSASHTWDPTDPAFK